MSIAVKTKIIFSIVITTTDDCEQPTNRKRYKRTKEEEQILRQLHYKGVGSLAFYVDGEGYVKQAYRAGCNTE